MSCKEPTPPHRIHAISSFPVINHQREEIFAFIIDETEDPEKRKKELNDIRLLTNQKQEKFNSMGDDRHSKITSDYISALTDYSIKLREVMYEIGFLSKKVEDKMEKMLREALGVDEDEEES